MTDPTIALAGKPSVLGVRPDPEVPEKPPRRHYTAAYKQRILEEADRCTEPGQIGALLRREGLYSARLSTWRRQREQAVLIQRRGRKAVGHPTQAEQLRQLARENAQLRQRLEQAQAIIDVQKKLSTLLAPPVNANGQR